MPQQPEDVLEINTQPQTEYITVTDLVRLFSRALDDVCGEVFFSGEISQVTKARSGHVYFNLKDSKSQIAAVMWAGMAGALTFEIEPGLSVLCHGRPNIYPASGKLQVVVHRISLAGEGALQKKFLELKAKLEAEGLFAPERKRMLPFLPRAVGLVTSKTGAVIHDMLVKFKERMPSLPLYLLDVKVQGEGAAAEIAEAIKYFSESNLVDVVIVARGGGSLEDLWPFNEEIVVRAVFGSRVPVVSGVGHEVDITLCDLAADLRAPTPTAAAELVVPKRADLLRLIAEYERRLLDLRWLEPLMQRLDDLAGRLDQYISNSLAQAKLGLAAAEAHIRAIEPRRLLATLDAKLQTTRKRLDAAALRDLTENARALSRLDSRLVQALPRQRIEVLAVDVNAKFNRLERGIRGSVELMSQRLSGLAEKLQAVSPKRVLDRGYAVVQHDGEVIRRATDVNLSDLVQVTLAQGGFTAQVQNYESVKK